MMNKTFASIKQGLQQAIRHRNGKRVGGLKLHVAQQGGAISKKPQGVLRVVKRA